MEYFKIENGVATELTADGKAYIASHNRITIPDGITEVGNLLFKGCDNLKEITISTGVTKIGRMAFENCYDLKTVYFPNTLKSIGSMAFRNCTVLKSAILPDSVEEMGDGIFAGCDLLNYVHIPKDIIVIGNSTFYGCTNLNSVALPSNLHTIEPWAFAYCPLKDIIIPSTVSYIGAYAFCGCDSVVSMSVPYDLEYLGRNALPEQSQWYKDITNGVEKCKNGISKKDSVLYFGKVAYMCTDKEITNVELKSDTTCLYRDLFKDCTKLVGVSLPDSLKYIQDSVFMNCTSLHSITIPNSVEKMGGIDIDYMDCNNKDYGMVFKGCTNLEEVQLSDKIGALYKETFADCPNLKTVDIKNVDYIEEDVFNRA